VILEALSGAVLGFLGATWLLGDIGSLVQGVLRGDMNQSGLRLGAFLAIVLVSAWISVMIELLVIVLGLIVGGMVIAALGTALLFLWAPQMSDRDKIVNILTIVGLLIGAFIVGRLASALSRPSSSSTYPTQSSDPLYSLSEQYPTSSEDSPNYDDHMPILPRI
jgi:MFS family permease